jgi:hypothetical protein
MEAGKEEQQSVVRFLNAEGVGRQEIHRLEHTQFQKLMFF